MRGIGLTLHCTQARVFIDDSIVKIEVLLRDFIPREMLRQRARARFNFRAKIGGSRRTANRICQRARIVGRDEEAIFAVV